MRYSKARVQTGSHGGREPVDVWSVRRGIFGWG
jgi:hypothetical protein